jgi:uroporphyrinogen-III decarboxylase
MAEEIPVDHIPYLVSTSNLKLFKETFGPKRVWMRVAYDASSLLNQTPSEIERECIKLMDIMAPGGGFMMDTGCLDWKTPEENVRTFIRAVKEHGSEMDP